MNTGNTTHLNNRVYLSEEQVKGLRREIKKSDAIYKARMKKEKQIPAELKPIFKMLDAVAWDVLQKYWKFRSNKESAKQRDHELKVRKQAEKDMASFIEVAGIQNELEYSPLSALVAINNSGLTPPQPYKTFEELRQAHKEINNVSN